MSVSEKMVSCELLVRPPRSWVSHFARSFGSLKFAGSHPRSLLHLVLIKMFHVLFRIHGSPRSAAGKLPSVRFRWWYWADRYFWWGLALFPREGSFSWAHCAQWRKKVESTREDSMRKWRYSLFPDFLFDSFSFPCLSPRASDGPASCRVERRTAKLLRKGKCDTWPAESEGMSVSEKMVSCELLVRPPRSWVSHFARSNGIILKNSE